MGVCRNCESGDLDDLGSIGKVAPFFLKRVFGAEVGYPDSAGGVKHWVRRVVAVPQRVLGRVSKPSVFVAMQRCRRCQFLQTSLPFVEDSINRLYGDYRSASYNRERIQYEPTYARIAADVGMGGVEVRSRVDAVTRFLKDRVDTSGDFTLLDYGGADGRFMPEIDARRYVYEISDVAPIAGATRIPSEAALGTYSLVQLAHVIEHVVYPLELLRKVVRHVKPGGFLYLETPQELSDAERAALRPGNRRRMVHIHEHINSYCVEAVRKLIEAVGLEIVAIQADRMDVGWAEAVHVRALGRRI